MTDHCSSCGSPIPEGQGSSCSMCYGDIAWGSDGYYEQWALEQLAIELAAAAPTAETDKGERSDKGPD